MLIGEAQGEQYHCCAHYPVPPTYGQPNPYSPSQINREQTAYDQPELQPDRSVRDTLWHRVPGLAGNGKWLWG